MFSVIVPRMDKGEGVVEDLGYREDLESIRQRFGKKLEQLKFEDLVRHSKYYYKSFQTHRSYGEISDETKALWAVVRTLKTFRIIQNQPTLRTRLIQEATARGKKTRDPQLQELFQEVLSTSTPWVSSTYYIVAAMLLRRLNSNASFVLS